MRNVKKVTVSRFWFWTTMLLSAGLGVWLGLGAPSPGIGDSEFEIIGRHRIEDFAGELVQYEEVFWDPRDTITLRRLIRRGELFEGKTVLEIGAGTGLLSFCCLRAGARHVVATDINPAAVANTKENARRLGLAPQLDVRLVPQHKPEAYSVIRPDERFDYIISNPPWEDRRPRAIEEHALYDEGFRLLRSLLRDMRDHLKPGGRAYLAYGSTDAIRYAQELTARFDLRLRLLDTRDVDDLPETFVPAIILEVKPLPVATPGRLSP